MQILDIAFIPFFSRVWRRSFTSISVCLPLKTFGFNICFYYVIILDIVKSLVRMGNYLFEMKMFKEHSEERKSYQDLKYLISRDLLKGI